MLDDDEKPKKKFSAADLILGFGILVVAAGVTALIVPRLRLLGFGLIVAGVACVLAFVFLRRFTAEEEPADRVASRAAMLARIEALHDAGEMDDAAFEKARAALAGEGS